MFVAGASTEEIGSPAHARQVELQAIGAKLGMPAGRVASVLVGRGTPEEVRRLTQALIDARKLPPPGWPDEPLRDRVRRMMCDYGIGFDCAGYVQQAFLAAHGIGRAQAGFAPAATNEALFDPSATGPFARVKPEKARPGDILVLGPPNGQVTGHRLLVFERHDLRSEEASTLVGKPEDLAALRSGRVSVFTVHSSFGSGGDPSRGGVGEQRWIYDAASNRWGRLSDDNRVRFTHSGLPYDGFHPLLGVYHYLGGR
jgi:hypothetical protein